MRTALLCACLLLASSSRAEGQALSRPNVVVVLADDLGWGDPRCYNPDSRIPTPHMDRLSAEGMRFLDAHSPSTLCTPTRYGLLTGRYAWRTRLKKGTLVGDSDSLIEPGRLTLASVLKSQGYNTACVGKWHLGLGWKYQEEEPSRKEEKPAWSLRAIDYSHVVSSGPLTVGFGEFFGIPASLDMAPYVFVRGDRVVELPTKEIAASEMRRHGGGGFWRAGPISPSFTHEGVLPRLAAEAEDFLRKQSPGRPFFLYLPLSAPHTPWMPTKDFRGRSGADWYGDFVAQVDGVLGRVLGALDERKLANDTIVIFTSDNGAHWLPEDIAKHAHRSNGPWRGQKGDWWEGGHRVPFVVKWPGRVKAGSVSEALICHTDVLATVSQALRADLPREAGEDSESFLPVLLGEAKSARSQIVHHSGNGGFAVREGDWKLCLGLGSSGFSQPASEKPLPGGPEGQLYNLREDPAESRNLWLEKPEVVRRLKSLLEKHEADGRSAP